MLVFPMALYEPDQPYLLLLAFFGYLCTWGFLISYTIVPTSRLWFFEKQFGRKYTAIRTEVIGKSKAFTGLSATYIFWYVILMILPPYYISELPPPVEVIPLIGDINIMVFIMYLLGVTISIASFGGLYLNYFRHIGFRNAGLSQFKKLILSCLDELYSRDKFLFERNRPTIRSEPRGICERCLVFRFAHYLQNKIGKEFYVDCDFNSSFNRRTHRDIPQKTIDDSDGTSRRRYVDIIVHERDWSSENDLICFEIKKWNNKDEESHNKDINNLKQMTSRYRYRYGFHLILGATKEETRWSVFEKGKMTIQEEHVFGQGK
jgi:hypothetical protein